MAWQDPKQPSTQGYPPFQAKPGFAEVAFSDLQPGDALNRPTLKPCSIGMCGHIRLFGGFVDAEKTRFCVLEHAGPAGAPPLARLGKSATEYADVNGRFPDPAPLTPMVPPRGKKEADAAGTWDHPTWKALGFRAAPEGAPHAYSFSFDSSMPATGPAFVAQARGDLDGDGVLSTFEIKGSIKPGAKAAVDPGMYIEAELE